MTKTVLVVDDSRLSRMMITALIKDECPEWTILEAEDGESALKISSSTSIDIATIDMNMPGMDGLTLGAELRKRFPEARLSMLTANVQKTVREKAEQSDLGFISKPITSEKINEFLQHEFFQEDEKC